MSVAIYNQEGIYKQELLNSHNPLITWSCKNIWNIRSVIFLLQQVLGPPNLLRWLTTPNVLLSLSIRSFHLQSYAIIWTRGHVKLRDKLKTLSPFSQCLRPPKPGRVATFNEELPSIKSGDSLIAWSYKITYKVRQPFKHVVFWDHVTNQKHFIMPEATKVSAVVT